MESSEQLTQPFEEINIPIDLPSSLEQCPRWMPTAVSVFTAPVMTLYCRCCSIGDRRACVIIMCCDCEANAFQQSVRTVPCTRYAHRFPQSGVVINKMMTTLMVRMRAELLQEQPKTKQEMEMNEKIQNLRLTSKLASSLFTRKSYVLSCTVHGIRRCPPFPAYIIRKDMMT
ncbi:hypothetical protein H2248_004197 [Termitomyces sp. 'cryptogamus']|nr:hypothetical protein H2248_004197 [Termitomyces sp. 'cryptogamus']